MKLYIADTYTGDTYGIRCVIVLAESKKQAMGIINKQVKEYGEKIIESDIEEYNCNKAGHVTTIGYIE